MSFKCRPDRITDRRWVHIQGDSDSESKSEYEYLYAIPRPPAKQKACGSHAHVCGKRLLIARTSAEFLGIIRDVGFY